MWHIENPINVFSNYSKNKTNSSSKNNRNSQPCSFLRAKTMMTGLLQAGAYMIKLFFLLQLGNIS
jgi:hypothetical protein